MNILFIIFEAYKRNSWKRSNKFYKQKNKSWEIQQNVELPQLTRDSLTSSSFVMKQ